MNPILVDMYSTVIPAAPFLIAAYVLVWIVLLVYVIMVVRGLRKAEAQLALLEETLEEEDKGSSEPKPALTPQYPEL